uniref:ORF245 protein n=1 Tax=Chlorella virus TaxID=10507 RepID=O12289_9PHYC|nr:ORF245 [Chlorella virus]
MRFSYGSSGFSVTSERSNIIPVRIILIHSFRCVIFFSYHCITYFFLRLVPRMFAIIRMFFASSPKHTIFFTGNQMTIPKHRVFFSTIRVALFFLRFFAMIFSIKRTFFACSSKHRIFFTNIRVALFFLRLIRTRFTKHRMLFACFFTDVCDTQFLLRFLAHTAITTTTFTKIVSSWRQRLELVYQQILNIREIPFITPLKVFYIERVNSMFLYCVSKFHTSTTFITMFAYSFLDFPRRHSDILHT